MPVLQPQSILDVLAHPAMARAFRLYLGVDASLLEFHNNLELFRAMSQKDSRETDRVLSAHARILLESCVAPGNDGSTPVDNPLGFSAGSLWEMENALKDGRDGSPIEVRIHLTKVSGILERAHEEVMQRLSSRESLAAFMQSGEFKAAAAIIRKEIAPLQTKLEALQMRLEKLNQGAPLPRFYATLRGGVGRTRRRLQAQIEAARLTLLKKMEPALAETPEAARKVRQECWSVHPEQAALPSRAQSS